MPVLAQPPEVPTELCWLAELARLVVVERSTAMAEQVRRSETARGEYQVMRSPESA